MQPQARLLSRARCRQSARRLLRPRPPQTRRRGRHARASSSGRRSSSGSSSLETLSGYVYLSVPFSQKGTLKRPRTCMLLVALDSALSTEARPVLLQAAAAAHARDTVAAARSCGAWVQHPASIAVLVEGGPHPRGPRRPRAHARGRLRGALRRPRAHASQRGATRHQSTVSQQRSAAERRLAPLAAKVETFTARCRETLTQGSASAKLRQRSAAPRGIWDDSWFDSGACGSHWVDHHAAQRGHRKPSGG